jgi:hypothetical protein
VSHQPERKEKDCLNCGAVVQGRYCQNCGQENIETRQKFGSLVKHFIYDIFHFDGKFFDTLKYLLLRPGFVPKEYVKGKRTSYLDPIRMYLFTSAVFFLVLFSISGSKEGVRLNDARTMSKQERLNYASYLNTQLAGGKKDSLSLRQLNFLLDTSYQINLQEDSLNNVTDTSWPIQLHGQLYLMIAEKQRAENKTEVDSSGNWLTRKLKSKFRHFDQKFGEDQNEMLTELMESFRHRLPYLLFVSLPFFALILKLLYVRRKSFYYSDHAVFTLYHYIVTFILLLLFFLVDNLNNRFHLSVLSFLSGFLVLSGGLYLLVSMKRFYAQGWGKTLGKFLLLNFFGLLILLLLMLMFLLFSLIQL